MDLRQLGHLIAVAEEGNFTRAAERCHIAQSGISASVAALERELGVALFQRTTRHVAVTDAGATLLEAARDILWKVHTVRQAVGSIAELERGSLTVGSVPTATFWFDLPELLARFHQLHPGVEISTVSGVVVELLDSVRQGTLDAALTGMPAEYPEGLSATEIATVPYGVLCPIAHPLAARTILHVSQLGDQVFIDLPERNVARAATDRVFAKAGIRRSVPFEAADGHMAIALVDQGLGLACLPRPTRLPARVRFVPLVGWEPWRLTLFTARAEHRTPAATVLAMLATGTPADSSGSIHPAAADLTGTRVPR